MKQDFQADKPLEKCVTDITELKAKDGKLYVSDIFDCFDLTVLGLAMDTNMRAQLCVRTLRGAAEAYLALRGAVVHSDWGSSTPAVPTGRRPSSMAPAVIDNISYASPPWRKPSRRKPGHSSRQSNKRACRILRHARLSAYQKTVKLGNQGGGFREIKEKEKGKT